MKTYAVNWYDEETETIQGKNFDDTFIGDFGVSYLTKEEVLQLINLLTEIVKD